MYPSQNQEPGNNVPPSAYYYAGASPYSAQGVSENTPSAYNMAAYHPLIIQHRGLVMDLLLYPWQSVRSLCQPGLRTFARETLHARWSVVWISIFALPLLSSLIALLLSMTSHHIVPNMLGGILLGPLVVIPILFFIVQAMIWPLARHYQGGGTFLEQCYTTFLSLAPFFLLGSVVSILLATDSTSRIGAILVLIEFLLFFYSSILLVVSLKAVHGLTTWEAIILSILPFFSILAVIVIVLIIAVMLGANNGSSSNNGNSSSGSGSNSKNSKNNNNNNQNNDTNSYQQQHHHHRNSYWWWWGRPRYATTNNNTNQGSKRQWLCPACRYRRWLRQGSTEVTCIRCDAPMQATDATR